MRCFVLALVLLTGCQGLRHESTRYFFEGDDAANYRLIFDREIPPGMIIANSIVVSYESESSGRFPDDFEFEFLAPEARVRELEELFGLRRWDPECSFVEHRLSSVLRDWYSPDPLSQFDVYRDITSVGYVHMQVRKKPDVDGRYRVFLSKH